MLLISKDWEDYEVIDTGNGEKLERWGNIILRRPDPQIVWPITKEEGPWEIPHGHYHRSSSGGGEWETKMRLPESWVIGYKALRFKISPTSFKHTGLFPEQAANWDFLTEKIKEANRPIRVLNLFAYTGGATVACAAAGAEEVVHVDASKGMIEWAKENATLSGLDESHIRYMIDDVFKFVQREIRRGRKYDVIIMDPPSYGRGPNKEIWKLEEKLFEFISLCMEVLSEDPLVFLVNSYTTGFSAVVLENILRMTILKAFPEGKITCGDIGLPVTTSGLVLPCGIYGRFEK